MVDASELGTGKTAGYADAIARDFPEGGQGGQGGLAAAATANEHFDAKRFAECVDVFVRLADARPGDLVLQIKAGVCCTCVSRERLAEGERRLRGVIAKGMFPLVV